MSIQLHIVTGFFGSGKTSFLKHYLNHFASEKKIAIIQNEFSPINIDGQELLSTGNYKILEINNGSVFCVCLLGSFIDSLNSFIEEVQPDEIIMEASGMSDPLGIGQIFQSEKLKGKVFLGHIWTVIDASNYFRAEALRNRINHQLRVADTIIVNKLDLVKDKLDEVVADIKRINPFARIVKARYSCADLSVIKKSFGVFPNEESAEDCRPDIQSVVIKSNQPISKNNLHLFFNEIKGDCIRSKGFVKKKGNQAVFWQAVYDEFSITEIRNHQGPTELVIIGNFTYDDNLQIRFDEYCKV